MARLLSELPDWVNVPEGLVERGRLLDTFYIPSRYPDFHVKGGDYDPYDYENMPEARVVHNYGGTIKIIKITKGKSTSNIIEKIRDHL